MHNPNKRIRRFVHLEAVIFWSLQAAVRGSETPHCPTWLLHSLAGSRVAGSKETRKIPRVSCPGEKAPEAIWYFQAIIVGCKFFNYFSSDVKEKPQFLAPVCVRLLLQSNQYLANKHILNFSKCLGDQGEYAAFH